MIYYNFLYKCLCFDSFIISIARYIARWFKLKDHLSPRVRIYIKSFLNITKWIEWFFYNNSMAFLPKWNMLAMGVHFLHQWGLAVNGSWPLLSGRVSHASLDSISRGIFCKCTDRFRRLTNMGCKSCFRIPEGNQLCALICPPRFCQGLTKLTLDRNWEHISTQFLLWPVFVPLFPVFLQPLSR